MSNKGVREELKALYGARCMLTGLKKRLTYHHLEKKCDGGENTLDNGAVLNREAHDFLHYLERTDPELYEEINLCLCLYKLAFEKKEKKCLKAWGDVEIEVKKKLIKK